MSEQEKTYTLNEEEYKRYQWLLAKYNSAREKRRKYNEAYRAKANGREAIKRACKKYYRQQKQKIMFNIKKDLKKNSYR